MSQRTSNTRELFNGLVGSTGRYVFTAPKSSAVILHNLIATTLQVGGRLKVFCTFYPDTYTEADSLLFVVDFNGGYTTMFMKENLRDFILEPGKSLVFEHSVPGGLRISAHGSDLIQV